MLIVELRHVQYRYPDSGGSINLKRRPALEDISLGIRPGARLSILGANGAGKSTLLMLLNGSLRPAAGELLFDGQRFDYKRRSLDRLRHVVALVLQDPDDQLFAGTVRQDISFGPMNLGLEEKVVNDRVENALQSFDLVPFADLPPHQLSHGQRKRVALAGAMAMQPRVLVLDEPTAALDPNGVDLLAAQLDALHQSGVAIVLTTHDLEFAYRFAEEVAVLRDGSLLAVGRRDLIDDAELMARSDLRVPTLLRGCEAIQYTPRVGTPHESSVPTVHHGGAPPLRFPDTLGLVDASASINPLGSPSWLRQEVSRWLSAIQRYPDPNCGELADAIASANGCLVESVVIGNGSSELLAWLPHVTAQSTWVVPVPSFGEYRRAPALAGRKVVEVPLSSEGSFAVEWNHLARVLSEPSVVVLGHPNNPTGTLLLPEAFHAFRARHPHSLFVVDEAFRDFVAGFRSVWNDAAENLVVLRSLTKILAIPGLRLGYALIASGVADRLRRQLPPWSVNLLAQRVGIRYFAEQSYVVDSCARVQELRKSLADQLRGLRLDAVHESCANWLLVRLSAEDLDASEVVARCLKYGVHLRGCGDFPGLGEHWLRISVRDAEQNARIVDALGEVLGRCRVRSKARPRHAIMLQGCSSDAGKSILTTALCRCLLEDGYRVAPFKAQNMSNNSGVVRDGGEIGRAQVLQALACKIEPDSRMNPVLLKPTSDFGAQVVIRGRSIGHLKALDYHATKSRCLKAALCAFDELSAEHEVVVCEGAGSSGEMNLRSADIVNMGFVSQRNMPVLLVGDIDRGGVYASFVGHMEVMDESDRKHVRGFLVNRFRGEASLLEEAHRWVEHHTGRPILGVVPYLTELGLPDEDRLSLTSGPRRWGKSDAPIQIAAVAGPHVSNFTDLDALTHEEDLCVRLVERPDELGQPDAIILLGTKNTLSDLAHFRRTGIADAVLQVHRTGATVIGICGGLQMLGSWIEDAEGVESSTAGTSGLGLLSLTTQYAVEKTVRRVRGRHVSTGLPVDGYEIHHGVSDLSTLDPWLVEDGGAVVGASQPEQRVFVTYLHGLFDADGFRRHFLDDLRERKGLGRLGVSRSSSSLEPRLAALAKTFRENVDLHAIYRLMGLLS